MPPAKSSRNHDDSKSDSHNAKEKNGNGHSSAKMRRGASQQSSHLREVTNAPTSAPAQPPAEQVPPSLQWSSFDRHVLHAYRREHRLSTPTSFRSPYHQWILSHPNGIGIHSPTMVRRRQARRQSKDHLALAVRKHFNGVGIQENDVIVDFIYKLQNNVKPDSKRQTTATTQ